jgi:hypothetical protein
MKVAVHDRLITAENNADGVGATFTITIPQIKQLDKTPYRDGAKSKSEQAASA